MLGLFPLEIWKFYVLIGKPFSPTKKFDLKYLAVYATSNQRVAYFYHFEIPGDSEAYL